ncbi:MAG: hypothetical protein AAF479_01420 [Pseudomonadota bacterium]
MPWTDEAIMASVTQTSAKMLVLEVLTRMRGRCRVKVPLDGSPIPPLYPGCTVTLTQQDAPMGEVPVAQLHGAKGGLENAETNLDGMIVLHTFRTMLEVFMPMYDPAREVYKAASRMIPVLRDEDTRWPIFYLNWEMEILSHLGHSGGLERCKSAFKHGETIYISPRTGKAASRAEAGAFLDRMVPVPGFFMGKKMATAADLRQGHEMTSMLFQKFAMPALEIAAMPSERADVIFAIGDVEGIGQFGDLDDEDFDEDAYRRRLLSLRTLRVAERSSGA